MGSTVVCGVSVLTRGGNHCDLLCCALSVLMFEDDKVLAGQNNRNLRCIKKHFCLHEMEILIEAYDVHKYKKNLLLLIGAYFDN